MAGMYPDNQSIEMFGESVQWPGVDASGKFTNGSFDDPLVKLSFIPAGTINLILNNLADLIAEMGGIPNNTDTNQLAILFTAAKLLERIKSVDGASSGLDADTLDGQQGSYYASADALTNALTLKAPLASPALTGIPTAPTAAATTNNTQIATTSFVRAATLNQAAAQVFNPFCETHPARRRIVP